MDYFSNRKIKCLKMSNLVVIINIIISLKFSTKRQSVLSNENNHRGKHADVILEHYLIC